jgi:hypothetical protein
MGADEESAKTHGCDSFTFRELRLYTLEHFMKSVSVELSGTSVLFSELFNQIFFVHLFYSDDSPRLQGGGFWNDAAVSSHSLKSFC